MIQRLTCLAVALLVAPTSQIASAGTPLPATAPAAADQGAETGNVEAEATVHYCPDGDTCRVRIAGSVWVNVRLAGIDAPEVPHGKKRPGQPLGEEARARLTALTNGKALRIRQLDLDQYNRPVVELWDGKTLLNLLMIEAGLAEAYRGPAKRLDRGPYLEAESKAKGAKLGIWGLGGYESPAEYRKKVK